jgi:hypothetical protein
MRWVWAGVLLLASLPFCVLAQQGDVLRENVPDQPAEMVPPPDDTVTSAPLPPPDPDAKPDDIEPAMVPNPLDAPNASPAASGKQAQPQGQPQRGGWVQMGTATLQTLDKVNARGDLLVLKVGDSGHFGSLIISVRGCFVRTADRPADATAYLVIRDQHPDAPGFTGWMVRSAPYLSMLAHPIYDVRVAGCSP